MLTLLTDSCSRRYGICSWISCWTIFSRKSGASHCTSVKSKCCSMLTCLSFQSLTWFKEMIMNYIAEKALGLPKSYWWMFDQLLSHPKLSFDGLLLHTGKSILQPDEIQISVQGWRHDPWSLMLPFQIAIRGPSSKIRTQNHDVSILISDSMNWVSLSIPCHQLKVLKEFDAQWWCSC